MVTINPAAAASAYANTAKAASAPGASEAAQGPSFSDFLKQTATDAVQTLKGGETASANAVTGNANLTDVVQSVTKAELTMQTMLAIRDKLVSDLQEIERTAI